jgi:DNA invertase Pin-like site-specific DNA recombinase
MTDRQRQHDLSIPDQRAQILAWCDTNGHQAVAEFVEGGATGTDDKRPVFQQMIERACDGDNPFEVIAVHSYSRFFRDAFGQEFETGYWSPFGMFTFMQLWFGNWAGSRWS